MNDGSVEALRAANLAFAARYPGEAGSRQPVHTVYGGAQLFGPDAARKLGDVAMRALREYAPDAATLGKAVGIEHHPALATIHSRVVDKLTREPVEDFRIDFEEGPVFPASYTYLEDRGITIVRDVLRAEARAVLERYRTKSGKIYNG